MDAYLYDVSPGTIPQLAPLVCPSTGNILITMPCQLLRVSGERARKAQSRTMVGLGGLRFCSCFEGRISEDAIPDLEPVLLVSGMGGSILNSKPKKFGFQTRVWVRILLADLEFKKKLWSAYNPRSGHCVFLVYISMAIADEKKFMQE